MPGSPMLGRQCSLLLDRHCQRCRCDDVAQQRQDDRHPYQHLVPFDALVLGAQRLILLIFGTGCGERV